jgi:hypothetical protein
MPFTSALHPHAPAGSPAGGQFAASGKQQQPAPAAKGKPAAKKKPATVKTKGKLTFAQQKQLRAQAAKGKVTLTPDQQHQLHLAHVAHEAHVKAQAAKKPAKAKVTVKAKPKATVAKKPAAKKPAVGQQAKAKAMARVSQ